jgi:hypothetical protein
MLQDVYGIRCDWHLAHLSKDSDPVPAEMDPPSLLADLSDHSDAPVIASNDLLHTEAQGHQV